MSVSCFKWTPDRGALRLRRAITEFLRKVVCSLVFVYKLSNKRIAYDIGICDLRLVLEKLRIGNVTLANRAFLAPMSGVTDLPFRRIAMRYGAGLVVSEMVASEQLVQGLGDTTLRAEGGGVTPHVVQLAGREERWMALGAKMAESGGADIIDINMGCPAKRVTTGYAGSALMRDLDQALRLIEATVSAVQVPVTLKMRLGWDDHSINAPELARRAEAAGVQLVTVHGRTRCQFYKGRADWSAIKAVSDAVSIPVVANGDCRSIEDTKRMLETSGAAGVMIGRGAYGRPWIVGLIGAALNGEAQKIAPKGADLADLVAGHYEAVIEHYGREVGLRAARKHISWYIDEAGFDIPQSARREMLTSQDEKAVARLIHDWFSQSDIGRAA